MSCRFFLNQNEFNWQEQKANVSNPEQTHKIKNVLRLRENDQLILLDGKGILYNAQITSFYSRGVQCRLLSRRSVNTEPGLKITIAQSLLKGSKFDYALQKNTEIGVFEFIPVVCERSVVRPDPLEGNRELENKQIRFQKIVQDASEQSERGIVPVVKDIVSLPDLCKLNLTSYDLKLICLERSKINGIREVINSIQDKVHKVLVLIGPEGGFTENEIKLALGAGFTSLSLGRRIYRSETVGTVIASILFFNFNELQ